MAAAVSSQFRYSTGAVATSETAKAFSWEAPVPVNTFWDSFEYSVARNFLANFSDAELTQLPIDEASSDDHRIKLQLLLRLLQEKLEQEEAATSPPQSLYTTDYLRWYQLWQGIYCLQDKLDLPEAEQTVRMLVEKRTDESNVVPLHMLADHLVKIRKYQEAEEIERPVCTWMDSQLHLGPSSPQAINARRIIAQALWGQGPSRRSEAEALVAEIHRLVDTMDGGKFGVYQAEEEKLNEELVAKLHIS